MDDGRPRDRGYTRMLQMTHLKNLQTKLFNCGLRSVPPPRLGSGIHRFDGAYGCDSSWAGADFDGSSIDIVISLTTFFARSTAISYAVIAIRAHHCSSDDGRTIQLAGYIDRSVAIASASASTVVNRQLRGCCSCTAARALDAEGAHWCG